MTGGGDCPGLNAVIRAVTKTAKVTYGDEIVGFLEGWQGVIDRTFIDLTNHDTSGLIGMGGTILGTSRSNPGLFDGGLAKAKESLDEMGLHALVVIGGDGTLRAAHELQHLGGNVIGVPTFGTFLPALIAGPFRRWLEKEPTPSPADAPSDKVAETTH